MEDLKPENVKQMKRYRNQELIVMVPAKFAGRDRDGDLIFETGFKCLLKVTVSPECFPLHVWKTGSVGQIKMKTKFE